VENQLRKPSFGFCGIADPKNHGILQVLEKNPTFVQGKIIPEVERNKKTVNFTIKSSTPQRKRKTKQTIQVVLFVVQRPSLLSSKVVDLGGTYL